MHLLHLITLLCVFLQTSSCSPLPMPMEAGGNAPRRGGAGRRRMTLFGQDISVSAGSLAEQEHADDLVEVNSHDDLLDAHIGEILYDPNAVLPADARERQIQMERNLQGYRFNVLYPLSSNVMPVNILQGHGHEYYAGHPSQNQRLRDWIRKRWPHDAILTPAQQVEKSNLEWTLYRSQQAMRYLHRVPNAAIYHAPSGCIYLSPDINVEDRQMLSEIRLRHDWGQLPQLKFTDRLHFKTSHAKKLQHRQGGRHRSMSEETSSDEEVA